MQWAISIGRWDIHTAVMTLSGFRGQPCAGNLVKVKQVYAYLINFRYFTIRFNTEEPDYGELQERKYDWSNTPYDNGSEDIPVNTPSPKGKRFVLSQW